MENSLDYKLGRPHPGKAKKRKTPCFPRGGALIPDLGRKLNTLGLQVRAPSSVYQRVSERIGAF